jgi:hypothetical protein
MTAQAESGEGLTETYGDKIPLGRVGRPEDIAHPSTPLSCSSHDWLPWLESIAASSSSVSRIHPSAALCCAVDKSA